MKQSLQTLSLGLLVMLLAGCRPARDLRWGPYLYDHPRPGEVAIAFDLGNGAVAKRIEDRVCAVGWDENYLVAQQYPNGDETVTNYFIINARKDSATADLKDVVVGPLSEAEFKKRAAELSLPPFTYFMAVAEVTMSR